MNVNNCISSPSPPRPPVPRSLQTIKVILVNGKLFMFIPEELGVKVAVKEKFRNSQWMGGGWGWGGSYPNMVRELQIGIFQRLRCTIGRLGRDPLKTCCMWSLRVSYFHPGLNCCQRVSSKSARPSLRLTASPSGNMACVWGHMAAKIKRGTGEACQWEAEHGALSKTYCCEKDAHQSGGLGAAITAWRHVRSPRRPLSVVTVVLLRACVWLCDVT